MKIKCPSCDKSYRTYDAIITHHGQTDCFNKKKITKKLLDSIDKTLKEKMIRHKLKKVGLKIDMSFYDNIDIKDYCENKISYDKKFKFHRNHFRILNRLVLSLYDID